MDRPILTLGPDLPSPPPPVLASAGLTTALSPCGTGEKRSNLCSFCTLFCRPPGELKPVQISILAYRVRERQRSGARDGHPRETHPGSPSLPLSFSLWQAACLVAAHWLLTGGSLGSSVHVGSTNESGLCRACCRGHRCPGFQLRPCGEPKSPAGGVFPDGVVGLTQSAMSRIKAIKVPWPDEVWRWREVLVSFGSRPHRLSCNSEDAYQCIIPGPPPPLPPR